MQAGVVTIRSATSEKAACVNTRPRFSKPRSMSKSGPEANNSNDVHRCPWDGCTDTFDTKRSRSLHHYHAHGESLTRKTRECEVCGDTFEFYSSTIDQRTCSNQCASTLRQEWVELSCENCGDSYKVKPQRKEDSRFCSHECYWEGIDMGSVELECLNCSDTFTRRRSSNKNLTDPFCSRECFIKYRGGGRLGGRETLYRGVRDYLTNRSWTNLSEENRLDECELCGSGENLHLHHIVPLLAGGTHGEYNQMTVCVSCHHGKIEEFTRKVIEFDMVEVGYAQD